MIRKIEHWITSDGRIHGTEKEAEEWEEIISKPEYQNQTYVAGKPSLLDIPPFF